MTANDNGTLDLVEAEFSTETGTYTPPNPDAWWRTRNRHGSRRVPREEIERYRVSLPPRESNGPKEVVQPELALVTYTAAEIDAAIKATGVERIIKRVVAMLEGVTDAAEAKRCVTMVDAIRLVCSRSRDLEHALGEVAEACVRARRRAGELLESLVHHGGDRRSASRSMTTTLIDIGISKTESSDWQALAAPPADVFYAEVKKVLTETPDNLTPTHMVKWAKAYARQAAGNGSTKSPDSRSVTKVAVATVHKTNLQTAHLVRLDLRGVDPANKARLLMEIEEAITNLERARDQLMR